MLSVISTAVSKNRSAIKNARNCLDDSHLRIIILRDHRTTLASRVRWYTDLAVLLTVRASQAS